MARSRPGNKLENVRGGKSRLMSHDWRWMNKAIKMDYGLWIDCGSSVSEDKSLVLAINTWDAGDLSDYSGLEFNSSFFPKCQD